MKQDEIHLLFEKFEAACYMNEGVECWSGRDIQILLGFTRWETFLVALGKAKKACEHSGANIEDHFSEAGRWVTLGNNAVRGIDDYALTRYACYLICQNADPTRKPAVAFAQTYFAVQTRRQEVIEQRLLNVNRLYEHDKLSKSEEKFLGVAYERGVDDEGFSLIRSRGDQALFGGNTTKQMKKKLGVRGDRSLYDFLPGLTLSAKDFATQLTTNNILVNDLQGLDEISEVYIATNEAARKMLIKFGFRPENLPAETDVEDVKSELEAERKKLFRDMKKNR